MEHHLIYRLTMKLLINVKDQIRYEAKLEKFIYWNWNWKIFSSRLAQ